MSGAEKLARDIASASAAAGAEKGAITADAAKNARDIKLRNVYGGITGDEADADVKDCLEIAEIKKGKSDKKKKETVYELELKEADAEKQRAAEAKYLDEAEKNSRAEKLAAVRDTLSQIYESLKEDEVESGFTDKSGSLSDNEIDRLCNTMIKNSNYRGSAYRSLLIREFKLMVDSGKFTDYDIERVKKQLYIKEDELK